MAKTRKRRDPPVRQYTLHDAYDPPVLLAAERAAETACRMPGLNLDYTTALRRATDATASLLLIRAILAAEGNPERAQALLKISKRKYYLELARLGLTDLPAKVRTEAERLRAREDAVE